MSWLHTWSGLLLGWLLFAIFVTGTLSYFRNEITFWMQPELHSAQVVPTEQIAFVRALALLAREAPDAQQWSLTLPSPRNPTLGLSWQQASAAENSQTSPGATRERGVRGAAAADSAEANRAPSNDMARERPNRREARGENGARREGRWRERGAEGAQSPDSATGNRPAFDGAARERSTRNETRGRANGAQSPETATENRPASDGVARERPSRNETRGRANDAQSPETGQQTDAGQQRPGAGARGQGQGGGGHRGPRLMLDPASGGKLEGRPTAGGNFLYRFHFELYGMDRTWARWIVGIATVLMFVALVSGVIVHRRIFKDFFTFRTGKGKRSWLDAHNASSVLSLPFHIIITFSGLVLFGNMMMPTAFQAAYRGDTEASYFREMRARMAPSDMPEASGESAPLITGLATLIAQAQETWGGARVGSITITHPGDRNAVIELRQMNSPSIAKGGRIVPALRFNGATGEPLATPALPEQNAVQIVSNVLNQLHRGFFATPVPRWLLFLSGIGGSLMVASGMVMWTVARARKTAKSARAPWGHRLVEVLNIAAIAGLMAAIAIHFWANRLIPADLPTRADWEIRAFFIAWAVTLVHAALRRPKAAWVEQLACAGALTALLPLVNAVTGGLSLPASIERGLGLLAGFDLCALVFGIGMLYAAYKVHRHTPRTRIVSSPPEEKPGPGTETETDAPPSEAMEEAA
jgi:uncharacterized iron-regulated membrane protein